MIVTIDGPAGAGKSSAARALAARLGFRFLDTGAMYRAVALMALERNVPLEDAARVAELADQLDLRWDGSRLLVDGVDVTDRLHRLEVTRAVRYVADNPQVRERLGRLQRAYAQGGNLVTEGRDQGTAVFPDASCKIFLTASPQERARRRLRDILARGEHASFEQVLAQQNERDRQDAQRPAGRLVAAPDAVHVVTDGLSPDEVLDRLEEIVRKRME